MTKPTVSESASGDERCFVWPPIGTKVAVLLVLFTVGFANRAGATLVGINFNDGRGDVGAGVINIAGANNTFQALSGYLDITSGGAAGHWNLYTTGGSTSYPNFLTSPAGAYWYNNGVYPTGVNPQYPGVNVMLDNYGLLFTQANAMNSIYGEMRTAVILWAAISTDGKISLSPFHLPA